MRSLFMFGKNIVMMRSKSILNKEAKVPLVFQVVNIELGFLGREHTTDGRQPAGRKAWLIKAAQESLFLVYVS